MNIFGIFLFECLIFCIFVIEVILENCKKKRDYNFLRHCPFYLSILAQWFFTTNEIIDS